MKQGTMVRFRFSATPALCGGLLAGALVWSLLAADAPPPTPQGKHGDASAEQQLADLQKLKLEADVTRAPAGLDPLIWAALVPQDNPMTPQRVELGRKLYFDTRLSQDNSVSCATCHDVTRGFTDQRAVSEGVKGQLGKRNAPTTLNAALLQTFFWDGRAPTLDHQAGMPVLNPVEMGMPNEAAVLKALRELPDYQDAFQKAYGREMNYEDLGRAIAAFERTLIFVDSPFRRFLNGDAAAISAQARAGLELFNGKARCAACHQMNPSNPLGTDNRFHNVGVSARHQNFEALAQKALAALGRRFGKEAR